MSEYTNIIGGRVKSSPYEIIRSKTKEFLEKYRYEPLLDPDDQTVLEEEGCEKLDVFLERNEDVIDFICTSRNVHKYAIMCFCHNQTSQGRIEDFTEEWYKEYGYAPNESQRTVLNRFARCYPFFIEYVFPNSQQKLNILKKVIDIVCEEAPKISIRTLDGEVINWAFYATEKKHRKYYDSVDHKHKSFNASTLKIRSTKEKSDSMPLEENISYFPNNLQLDSVDMKQRFLSYLIHSIAASILRRIINMMKKDHKSSINHLHDCVILHLNDFDSLHAVIKKIYSSPDIYNLIENGVFDQIESVLSNEGKEKLKVLKKAFFELTDDFISEIGKINPHHMYSLQD